MIQFTPKIVQALSHHPLTSVEFGGNNTKVENLIRLVGVCPNVTSWKFVMSTWNTDAWNLLFSKISPQILNLDLSGSVIRPVQLPLQHLKNLKQLKLYLNPDYHDWPLEELKHLVTLDQLKRVEVCLVTPESVYKETPEATEESYIRYHADMKREIQSLQLPFECIAYNGPEHFGCMDGTIPWRQDSTNPKFWHSYLGPCIDYGRKEAELGSYSGRTEQKLNHYEPYHETVLPGVDITTYKDYRVGSYFETYEEELRGYFDNSHEDFGEDFDSDEDDSDEDSDDADLAYTIRSLKTGMLF